MSITELLSSPPPSQKSTSSSISFSCIACTTDHQVAQIKNPRYPLKASPYSFKMYLETDLCGSSPPTSPNPSIPGPPRTRRKPLRGPDSWNQKHSAWVKMFKKQKPTALSKKDKKPPRGWGSPDSWTCRQGHGVSQEGIGNPSNAHMHPTGLIP